MVGPPERQQGGPEVAGDVRPGAAIDPKTERFTGNNDKANAMLSREFRKGFEPTERA